MANLANYLVIESLGQVDPRDLGPGVPVRWADYDVIQRPFISPEDEFVRSPYPVSAQILRERWQGLYAERDLALLRETAAWQTKRFEYQERVSEESLKKSYAGDALWVSRRLDREIIDLSRLIETINADLEAGYEYARVKGSGAGPLGYVKQPMTADSRRKLVAARIDLSKQVAELLGLAPKIVKVDVSIEEPLSAKLERYLLSNDPEFAALKRIADGGLLPVGALAAGDGDALEAARRVDFENGRVIDATPLPRLEDL